MPNSKQKGNRGEREWSQICREAGYKEAKRGQQYSGIGGDDVVGVPGLHMEVKRVEALNIHKAMEQSVKDKKGDEIPIVAHRRNREKWLVTLHASDFLTIYEKYLNS